MLSNIHSMVCAVLCAALALPVMAAPEASDTSSRKQPGKTQVGKTQKGKASFYAQKFAGRKMADGTPMNPNANIAASRTLPLGTKAKVTNLENGKSEIVEIRDRGPYIDGRVIDVSPKVAEKLDMKKQGVAPVAVTPIEVPARGRTAQAGDATSGMGSSGE